MCFVMLIYDTRTFWVKKKDLFLYDMKERAFLVVVVVVVIVIVIQPKKKLNL